MNRQQALEHYSASVEEAREHGTFKEERVLAGPQGANIDTLREKGLVNMCSNNYLGLCVSPQIVNAAKDGLDKWGYGLSSVRFICGTQKLHKELEAALSAFLETEDTLLYSSCFDANGGLFEVLLSDGDAVISDELNHASIIDGIRLCAAKRYRYKNNDMADLEAKLKEAAGAGIKLIATDGVFSMDGTIANLRDICALSEQYGALVMVDDSHAVGFMGQNGRGTPEYCGVQGKVDIITGTLGKALGGAAGGYTSARAEIVALLRQRSRPYLFSNTVAPAIAAASLEVLSLLRQGDALRSRLAENTRFFRAEMLRLGFDIAQSEHPIVAVMLYDAVLAGKMAARLLELGVYVIPFSYPVVPKGKARIRVQVSAAHTREQLRFAAEAFAKARD